ncbi:alpha/beta hydrolase [Halieaceae bacterium IMCC14734]|uniref:Alpha/beta hydrolase n=1 Tax=Candidatus Litorirhabdus singularis TaxID=2518993 RepID=A0ABT3TCP9_9GAMM|nr:alpha/beta hydrolase [Candidatus Litorirhabdus singularis]MCX2980062.1 alpha/beta hydrolase [Candidatus Litorirhabdus singularis]
MISVERLAAVAADLRPINLGAGPLSSEERAYLAAYNIDFQSEFAGLTHALGYLDAARQRLAVHILTVPAAKGNLLLVHGYFDHVGLFGHLIRFGLERGYNVVAFDLPGHGLSTGAAAVIEDFGDYAEALQAVQTAAIEALPGDWYVIAQSTGGAAVLESLVQGWRQARAIALLAPLVRPVGWYWVQPAHAVLRHFRKSLSRKFAQNSNDPVFLEFLRNDPLQARQLSLVWIGALRRWLHTLPRSLPCQIPILVLQGDNDETVDGPFNTAYIERMIDNVELQVLPGARHQLANESASIRQQIGARLDQFFSNYPLSS